MSRLLDKALALELEDGKSLMDEKSPCCNATIIFTENSGVYVCPNVYCDLCKKFL